MDDSFFMLKALALAQRGADAGEVPVGAVLVLDGEVVGEGFNQPISSKDPTAHAEVIALREAAARVGNYRLPGSTLYVTLEPCTMCAGAMVHARVERLVFGTAEPKSGAVVSNSRLLESPYFNHLVVFDGGVLADECATCLRDFFKARRNTEKRDFS